MTNQHPITPPPELAQQWVLEAHSKFAPPGTCPDTRILIARAAQWGADQELEACCEYVYERLKVTTAARIAQELRAARRPKPPSLKEQALAVLEEEPEDSKELIVFDTDQVNIIRRALEQLDD